MGSPLTTACRKSPPHTHLSPPPPPPPHTYPLCDMQSIGGFFTGPWTVTRVLFAARCSADPLLKVRHAAVLTPPFLLLHRRRVGVVKT